MADKFTRLTGSDGNVVAFDDSGNGNSIEELEDNIDDKLLTVINADNTGASSSSTMETTMVSYTIPANTVRTGILVMAGIRFVNSDSGGSTQSGTFNLKIGGSTVKSLTLTGWDHGVGGSSNLYGTAFFYWDTSQTWTGSVDVEITAQNGDSQNTSYVDSFIILGI